MTIKECVNKRVLVTGIGFGINSIIIQELSPNGLYFKYTRNGISSYWAAVSDVTIVDVLNG
jgi:hypothetical protein